MSRREELIKILDKKHENDSVDFKREYYHAAKKYDLIKDLISFSNSASFGEKYIIFGVDDKTREIIGIDKYTIPDISEVNQLIRVYCDPYIDIEKELLDIEGKTVVAIVILANNYNKPYTMCKDYMSDGKKYFCAGDIYIRKSANNFRALRSDIEEIYMHRDVLELSNSDDKVYFRTIMNIRQKERMCCIAFNLCNNTDKNFVIGKAMIRWQYSGTSTGSDIRFITDNQRIFPKGICDIGNMPFVVNAKTQYIKMIYLNVSESFQKVIQEHEKNHELPSILISFFDAQKIEHQLKIKATSIVWEE